MFGELPHLPSSHRCSAYDSFTNTWRPDATNSSRSVNLVADAQKKSGEESR